MSCKLISDLGHGSRGEGSLPIAAGLAPEIESAEDEASSPEAGDIRAPRDYEVLGGRTVFICGLSIVIGAAGAVVAQVFVRLIGLATNVAFYGKFSAAFVDPAGGVRGPVLVLIIPVVGSLTRDRAAALRVSTALDHSSGIGIGCSNEHSHRHQWVRSCLSDSGAVAAERFGARLLRSPRRARRPCVGWHHQTHLRNRRRFRNTQ